MARKGNLLDCLNRMVAIENMGEITKEMFGKFMHDPNKTHEEKMEFLDRVEQAGGYEALL